MKSPLYGQSLKIAACAIESALAVASLAGCGASVNFQQSAEPDVNVSSLSGIVHGGPNPVIGATATLYATSTVSSPSAANNYGYGQPGTVLATATTLGPSGSFSFSSVGTCPAGQQAYIVASGGNSASQLSSNSAALLMAAIGPCASLSPSTSIVINEASTIAAAYAIGQFMTVSGTTVNISAPANNNAAAPGCTMTGEPTSCSAAGLAHAFLNAANLVNAVGTTTAPPNGFAYSVLPTNSSATVPQSLINTLANSVEACINSSGSNSTPCTTLMTDTTPATALLASATAPTNTLQAMIDLAQYPQPSNAAAIFNIGSPNATYQPSLTAAPADFTIAINFSGANGINFVTPSNLATDIQDNIYIADMAFRGPAATTVESIASNGLLNWLNNQTVFDDTGGNASGMATDTLGNLYVGSGVHCYQIATANGAPMGSSQLGLYEGTLVNVSDVAVDKDNDAFLTIGSVPPDVPSYPTLQEFAFDGTTASLPADLLVDGAWFTHWVAHITIDNHGDLWLGDAASPAVYHIANPYSTSAPTTISTSGNAGVASKTMIDSFGNAWFAGESGLSELPFGSSPTYVIEVLQGWFSSGSESIATMDGDNKIVASGSYPGPSNAMPWVGVWYPTGSNPASPSTLVAFNPCNVGSGTTCPSPNENYGAGSIALDDTGSIWATSYHYYLGGDIGNVLQILGPGAPTWGQASLDRVATGTTERPY